MLMKDRFDALHLTKCRRGPRQLSAIFVFSSLCVQDKLRYPVLLAGSRSSPLTAAVAMQPRLVIVPCIDERSLGFWAVGHAKATG